MLDERQYRADQPCGDRISEPCATWDRPRSILGRRQLEFGKHAAERVARRLEGDRRPGD